MPTEYVLVDLDDYDRVSRSRWYSQQSGKSRYAIASSHDHVPERLKALHRYVLWAKPGQIVDHINGDTFDNRKQNLRFVTAQQNSWNARRQTFPGKTSRFKGVSWDKGRGKWLAGITFKGERHDISYYEREEDAALAYDKAALICFGEYARTNEVMRLFEMDDPFIPDAANTETPTGAIAHSEVASHGRFYFRKAHNGEGPKKLFVDRKLRHYVQEKYDMDLPA